MRAGETPPPAPSGERAAAVLLTAAGVLWAWSLVAFDRAALRSLGDLGLAPALPWQYFGALAVLLVGYVLLLRAPRPRWGLAIGYVLALIALMHATPAVLYGTPRYPFTYKHVGVAGYVREHGAVDPMVDAYHDWPGFFALDALLADVGGLPSLLGVAVWAPVAMNVLLALGLLTFMYGLGAGRHPALLAVWLTLLANWVGQDYFAPQALAMALHLVTLGLYLAWFGREGPLEARLEPGPRSALALVLLALVHAAVVAAHQLTPFVTLASVAALVVLRRGRAPLLPLVMGTAMVLWFTYPARPFFLGHMGELLDAVGRLLENLEAASAPLRAVASGPVSSERATVLLVRQGTSLAMGVLAVVGAVRAFRSGRAPWTPLVLALLPAGLVALQPYGGEIAMRVYMFALPALAHLAAGAFFPSGARLLRGAVPAALATTALLAGGMTLAYYGNESMNYVPPQEVAALEALYAQAPAGALVVTPTDNPPVRHERYDQLRYTDLGRLLEDERSAGVEAALQALRELPDPSVYVLLSRSQEANARLFGRLEGLSLDALQAALAADPGYHALFVDDGAAVFERRAEAAP